MHPKRNSIAIMRAVLFALMLREIRGRFGANRLGAFWFVCEPLAQLALLLVFFSIIRAPMINGVPLLLFLINGIIPFTLFKNIALTGMQAVNANRGLFAYRQIQAIDMIIARALVETVLMSLVYIAMLFSLSFFWEIDVAFPDPIAWVIVLLAGIALSLASAIVFCIFISYFPELANVVRMLYFPLYLISGVIFPVFALPRDVVGYLLWNPYLHIIEMLRLFSISNYHATPHLSYSYPIAISVIALFVSIFFYRKTKSRLVAA